MDQMKMFCFVTMPLHLSVTPPVGHGVLTSPLHAEPAKGGPSLPCDSGGSLLVPKVNLQGPLLNSCLRPRKDQVSRQGHGWGWPLRWSVGRPSHRQKGTSVRFFPVRRLCLGWLSESVSHQIGAGGGGAEGERVPSLVGTTCSCLALGPFLFMPGGTVPISQVATEAGHVRQLPVWSAV